MSRAPTLARSYEALRPKVLQRLLELRATLDPSLGRSRVVALAAVARAGRDRAARMREELSHRQLQEVLEKQKAAIQRREHELTQDLR